MHAVSAEKLGGRVNRDVDTVLEGPEQRGREHRVIHDDRQAVLVRRIGDGAEIRNIVLGIPNRFQVYQARVLVHQLVYLFRVVGIKEPNFDTQLLEGLVEKRPGAAVQASGGNEVLPGMHDGEHRGRDGRRSRGKRQPADAAVESGQPLLQHIVGGVHQARVDVAEFAQTKKVGGRFGVLENVARCCVNRNRPRRCGWVGLLPRMQGKRVETLFPCFCHTIVLRSMVRKFTCFRPYYLFTARPGARARHAD
jgi:hypothetical protein